MRAFAAFAILVTASTASAQQAAGPGPEPIVQVRPPAPSAARFLGTTVPIPITVAKVATPNRVATAETARVATGQVTKHDEPPPAGIGGTFVFGSAGQRGGPQGYVVRYDYELFSRFPHGDDAGAVMGNHVGYEYWRSGPDNWGFALPIAWTFGVRVQPVRATAGFGVDLVLVDQVANDTGVGLFAPFGVARVGSDVHGFQFGIDARIERHWQFGADDHTRWQLGAFVGKTWEPSRKRPLY